MPTIDVSEALHTAVITNSLALCQVGSGGARYYGQQWANSGALVQLMKGTQAITFDNLINQRNADVLCQWPFWTNTPTNSMGPSSLSNNILTLKSYYSNAIASGTATWFRWISSTTIQIADSTAGHLTNQVIIGTVGGVGSGADLIMQGFTSPDPVNIVSGQRYKLENLQFSFQNRSWTY